MLMAPPLHSVVVTGTGSLVVSSSLDPLKLSSPYLVTDNRSDIAANQPERQTALAEM